MCLNSIQTVKALKHGLPRVTAVLNRLCCLLVCLVGFAEWQEVGVTERLSIDQYELCTAACS